MIIPEGTICITRVVFNNAFYKTMLVQVSRSGRHTKFVGRAAFLRLGGGTLGSQSRDTCPLKLYSADTYLYNRFH